MGGCLSSEGCAAAIWRQKKKRALAHRTLKQNACTTPRTAFELGGDDLGEGAFGKVTVCHSKKTGATRAIKTICKSMLRSIDDFWTEIHIQSELSHPNILRIFESFECDWNVHIVMEACRGGTVLDQIGDGLNESDACALMQQLMSAINYMHCQGVAHRDLKPDNFLLEDKEIPLSDNTLKLIDFGFARRATPGVGMTTMCGTPCYMAPEIFSGNPYTEKCDVFSAGVIFYFFLSGELPWDGETLSEINTLVARGMRCQTFEQHSQKWSHVSGTKKLLIMNMCKLDVARRFSAAEVLNSSWIQHDECNTQEIKVALDEEQCSTIAMNIKSYMRKSRLEKNIREIIVTRLDDNKIKVLRNTYMSLDRDRNGTISFEELKLGFEKLGVPISKSTFEDMDFRDRGEVDYNAFLAACIERESITEEQACWSAFRLLDSDNDGKITATEMVEVLGGDSCLHVDAQEFVQQADINNDGEIDFDEFMKQVGAASHLLGRATTCLYEKLPGRHSPK